MRAIALLSVLGACVQSGEVVCADGRLCPPGYQCDDVNMRCLSAEQVAACTGREEGTECSVAGAPGACRMGACEPLVCGDGTKSVGEICDGTDLGGATCKDAGFYDEAGLACTSFCTFDVSGCTGKCGDSIVNGLELCDGAPPAGACADYGFDAGRLACGAACGLSFEGCARFGWVPETTTLVNVLSLDASGEDDIWVAGDAGSGPALAHFDGTVWTAQPLVGTSPVHAIAAVGPGDAWIVRGVTTPTLERFSNGQWTPVTGAPAATYRDVWAAGPSAVYVATIDAGVLAWNGSAWTTLGTLADPLTAIEGSGPDDIWALTTTGALQHWTGSAWSPLAVDINVKKVEVTAANDLWVVGPSTTQTDQYAIGHWDGTSWTITLDPTTNPQFGQRLGAIAAAAPNDVWLATRSGQARHFDGRYWSPTGTVVVDASQGAFQDMKALPGRVVAITFDGYFYRYTGQLYARFDSGSPNPLVASSSVTPSLTVAIDSKDTAFHFNGQSWTPKVIENVTPLRNNRAIWARAADDIWVGGNSGKLFHYDGVSWSDSGWGQNASVAAIVGFAANDIWFFGSSAVHYTGTFDAPALTGNSPITAASGSGPSDIWALGNATAGTDLYRWNGATWTTSHHDDELSAIVAIAPDNVFATAGNRIWHWNGTAWTAQTFSVLDPFIALSATGPSDVFAATKRQLMHFDGTQWNFVRTPVDAEVANRAINNISALPDRVDIVYDVIAASAQMRRLIRTRAWDCAATETACADGVDNDCDGTVDALDLDCP